MWHPHFICRLRRLRHRVIPAPAAVLLQVNIPAKTYWLFARGLHSFIYAQHSITL
jgi:hypothetical protein